MSKTVDGKEYLTYDEIAVEYGYNRSYVPSMVTNGAFPNVKFERDVKRYVSREHLEAYKNRKNKAANEMPTPVGGREVPQGIPFLARAEDPILMEAIRLNQQIESNRQKDQALIRELITARLQIAM